MSVGGEMVKKMIEAQERKVEKAIKNKEQIIEALKTIQEVCNENNNDCECCPLYACEGICGVMDLSPDNWKINDPNEIWRALM